MKITTILFSLIFSTCLMACGGNVKPDQVVESINSVDPIFRRPQGAATHGIAKANLNINEEGKVIGVELVSIEPAQLDKEPIIKAFKKTKFSSGKKKQDYLHSIEFQIQYVTF